MPHLPRPVVEAFARRVVRGTLELPLPAARRGLTVLSLLSRLPAGVGAERVEVAGVPAELVRPAGAGGPPRVLYLHGGAYRVGSPRTHRAPVGHLARSVGAPVLSLDYRLAPESPAPGALDDALGAYLELAERGPAPVALAGDSAGGGLALATAIAARDHRHPRPAALALISPWVDLTLSGASIEENRGDAMLTRTALERGASDYAAPLGADDPRCSPIRADLGGLPPMLIHVAGDELLLSEARELATRARAAGCEVELEVFPGLWHDFHSLAGTLREADRAVAQLGAWLASRLA